MVSVSSGGLEGFEAGSQEGRSLGHFMHSMMVEDWKPRGESNEESEG
jgi:hypothetical protein